MCLCRKRPCCRCVWKRCTCCARHICGIRMLLILFGVIDMCLMVWYLYAMKESRDDITSCCGVSDHYPKPPIHNPSLVSNYSTCSDLDYTNTIISTYYDLISPFNKHFLTNIKHYNLDHLQSIFTYYSINVTVDRNGGCVYHDHDMNINCLSDTTMPCVQYMNQTIANATNTDLSSMCYEPLSTKQISYIQFGILFIILLKLSLLCIGFCCKICRRQIRPESEYIHNLLHPRFIPPLCMCNEHKRRRDTQLLKRMERAANPDASYETPVIEKSETIDMSGAKSYYAYYRMKDRRKNRHICCKILKLPLYLWYFIYWVLKCTQWLIQTAFWLIIFLVNFICSCQLFWIHHSPILGIDFMDFCAHSVSNSVTCAIGHGECGASKWIILKDVDKYLFPRHITLILALLLCLLRCVERCAGFKLQELVARQMIAIEELNVDRQVATAFKRYSIASHNQRIGDQFDLNEAQLEDDLSANAPHIEMSHSTDSLRGGKKNRKTKTRKKLYSSLDILEDNRIDGCSSTSSDEDDDDVLESSEDETEPTVSIHTKDNLYEVGQIGGDSNNVLFDKERTSLRGDLDRLNHDRSTTPRRKLSL
eukprot:15467_1